MAPETIDIILNGRPDRIEARSTLQDLVRSLGAGGPGTAVAVNDEVVRREVLGSLHLKPGDKVEIIHAVGGG